MEYCFGMCAVGVDTALGVLYIIVMEIGICATLKDTVLGY